MGNPWPDDKVEQLKALWVEGLTASQIARVMGDGLTRSAVIGKVHRLGLPGKPKNQRAEHSGCKPKAKIARIVDVPAEPIVVIPALTLPDGSHVTILTVTHGQCRWPIGDPESPDFHLCGNACPLMLPYCVGHTNVAYQPATRRVKSDDIARMERGSGLLRALG